MMTPVKYLLSTGVCNTSELLQLRREYPADYDVIMKWTKEQAANLGITLDEVPAK